MIRAVGRELRSIARSIWSSRPLLRVVLIVAVGIVLFNLVSPIPDMIAGKPWAFVDFVGGVVLVVAAYCGGKWFAGRALGRGERRE